MPIPGFRAIVACAAVLLGGGLGGCSQQMAVQGRSDRLYAEAQGALRSEGFRPIGRTAPVPAAQGSDPRSGRLQFLYYADTVSPTVVEVRIAPSEGAAAAAAASPAGGASAPAEPSSMLAGAHQVIVKAWSSMTLAPDPFIADLAMGVLRRAYTLSGNAP